MIEQRILDREVRRDGFGNRKRALLVLAVQLLAGLPDGGGGADQRRQQDDRDLENQDLVGQGKPGFHV